RRARKPVAEDAAQAVAPPAEAPAPSRPRKDETVVVSSAATPVQPVVAPAPVITPVEELAAESERGTGPLRTFGVIVVAVVVAMFLNSTALLRSAEQMKPGAWRSVLLGVARPVDRIARDAHLTAPRHALDRALGRGGSQGSGPGLSDVPVSVPKGAAPVADGGSAPAASVPPPPTASTVTTAPTPPAFRPASLRPVDAHHPLKLWVTGDSQITYLGESLLAQTSDAGTVKSFVPDTHDGTGLVRPDNYDWLKASLAYIAKNKPDAVVITLGGNDYKQGIPAGPGKAWPAGSTGWAAAYQARAVAVMKALTGNGQRPVYWVTTPDIRDAAGNHAVQVLDQAVLAAAATVPGVVVVDARPVLSPDGKYHAYRGTTLIRAGDGLHATFAGSELVAKAVLAALNADWHLTK
ncbi:MAG TPA: DUF459 domain-containing protein, partial [Mycobacteriales bacterium]|nr:DUF459 domain-containing protein [Mycobacteriales bacterium]